VLVQQEDLDLSLDMTTLKVFSAIIPTETVVQSRWTFKLQVIHGSILTLEWSDEHQKCQNLTRKDTKCQKLGK